MGFRVGGVGFGDEGLRFGVRGCGILIELRVNVGSSDCRRRIKRVTSSTMCTWVAYCIARLLRDPKYGPLIYIWPLDI